MDWSDTEIRIDRDCNWYCDGTRMVREDIIELLSRNVVEDKAGKWLIKFKNQSYPVIVEDVPFLVKEITDDGGTLKLRTNDNRQLNFPHGGIRLKNDIPYVSLFNNRLDAKLSRSAFWKLNQFIKEENNNYKIVYAGKTWPVLL